VVVALPRPSSFGDAALNLDGTLASHAVNVSATLTTPLATKYLFSVSVTLLE
jgi:hypothetical protein